MHLTHKILCVFDLFPSHKTCKVSAGKFSLLCSSNMNVCFKVPFEHLREFSFLEYMKLCGVFASGTFSPTKCLDHIPSGEMCVNLIFYSSYDEQCGFSLSRLKLLSHLAQFISNLKEKNFHFFFIPMCVQPFLHE